MLALNAKSMGLGPPKFASVLHQPLGGGYQRGLVSNHDPGPPNLRPSLGSVASIGKEHTVGLEDRQNSGCSSKSAEVSNVRKVGDEKRTQRVAIKNGLQLLQTSVVIHVVSLTSRRD